MTSPVGQQELDGFKGRLREALGQEFRATVRPPVGAPRRPRAGLRRAPLALAALTGLAVLAAGLLPGGAGRPRQASAAALNAAADLAAAGAGGLADLRPGQSMYTKVELTELMYTPSWDAAKGTWNPDRSFLAVTPMTVSEWLGPDGRGKQRLTYGQPTALDQGAWAAAGRPRLFRSAGGTNPTSSWNLARQAIADELGIFEGPGEPVPVGPDGDWRRIVRGIQQLPSDPAGLDAWLEARADRLRDAGAGPGMVTCASDGGLTPCSSDRLRFELIGALLGDPLARPQLRAAAFRAAARIKAVELLGKVTDRAGRGGLAVALTSDGVREELIFDPATSRPLATRMVTTTRTSASHPLWPGVRAGTEVESSLLLEQRVAGEVRP